METKLQQLNVYFNGYPRIMFTDALLKLYASCDRKFAEVRGDLFTIVSKMPGYPYPGSGIKRHFQSRTGDTLVEKLVLDIHTLLSGADFSSPELKEVLSTSRKTRSAPVPTQESSERISTPSIVRVATLHNKTVPWRSDLNELSETIHTLTADILGMKQLHNANESSRSAQVLWLRDSMYVVSNGMAGFKHLFPTP